MDNRRFSARADIGSGAARLRRDMPGQSALDRVFDMTRLNWEVVFFVGMMIVAVLTRLWDLGPRAFHHDESIHAYFSNYYLKTGSYTTTANFGGGYDPTYHGPFLYHIVALMFFLFGVNDANARLAPALFGIALIGLCWLFRPFIGRVAAMVATFLIIISPSISYYSRSLRHDIFALFGLTLLFVCILWFMRTHQSKWVYLGSLGLIIAYASHELTYIVALIFVLFLALAYFLYPRFADRSLLGTRTLNGDEEVNPVGSALAALRARPWTLAGAALIFLGIYTLLFTNMLTKPQLIGSGIIEGIRYWGTQQEVNRGGQPVWYYMLLMPIYEPLALLGGLGTIGYLLVRWIRGSADVRQQDDVDIVNSEPVDEYGVAFPSMSGLRGLTLGFLAFWSIGAFIAFSMAGERLPWLNMHIAMPFTLLASAGLGALITRMQWSEVRKGGGAFLGVAVVLFIFALVALIASLNGTMPRAAGATADLQNGLRGVLLFLITVGLLGLSGWLAYKMLPRRAVAVVTLTFAVLLAAYGLRSMFLATYLHGDVPVEMLIYTQSSPDVPIVSHLVERLSRDESAFDAGRTATDVTGGHSMEIAIDQNDAIEWPLDWYFRDQRGLKYFNYFNPGTTQEKPDEQKANLIAPNAPVILVSEPTENLPYFKNLIKDKYTTGKYPLNWWFPEDTYKTNNVGDIGQAIQWLTGNGMKYLLYRDPGKPLGSRNFYLHVRNDLAVKAGLGVPAAGGSTAAAPTDNKEHGMFELSAGAGKGQFSLPRGITRDAAGNFYVVDTGNFRIEKFDPSGKWLLSFGNGKGTGDGQFNPINDQGTGTGPGGIATDKAGNVYVADTWNHRIQKFDSTGKFVGQWGGFISLADPASSGDASSNSKFYGPRGVTVGPDGNVYVSDTGNKRISVFDPSGKFIRQMSSNLTPDKITSNYPFSQPGEMNEPIGVAVDNSGNVYVADSLNKRIQKFDPSGKSVAQWPVPGNNWDGGAYLEPFLVVDSSGNVYATAPTGQAVLEFSPSGQVLATKKNAGAITLKTPTGITVDPDGTVYVVDTGANGVVNFGKLP